MDLAERFWARVDRRDPDDCWLWIGCCSSTGYGAIYVDGKQQGAHRVSYAEANGPIPEGMLVCHKCDVPACVNPQHLFLGTVADNTRDAYEKGRLIPPTYRKLSDADVQEIRRRTAAGERQRDVAAVFAIDQSTVSNIVRGHTWRSI